MCRSLAFMRSGNLDKDRNGEFEVIAIQNCGRPVPPASIT